VLLGKVALKQTSAAAAEMDNSPNNRPGTFICEAARQLLGHAKAVTQVCIATEQAVRPGSGQEKWASRTIMFRK